VAWLGCLLDPVLWSVPGAGLRPGRGAVARGPRRPLVTVDLPRSFTIRESSHRIHNPFTSEKLAALGQALSPAPGTALMNR